MFRKISDITSQRGKNADSRLSLYHSLNKLIFQSKVMKLCDAFKPSIPHLKMKLYPYPAWIAIQFKQKSAVKCQFVTVPFAFDWQKRQEKHPAITIETIRWMCDLETRLYSPIWINRKDPVTPCANTMHFTRISFAWMLVFFVLFFPFRIAKPICKRTHIVWITF